MACVQKRLNGRLTSSRFVLHGTLYRWLCDSSTGPLYKNTRCLILSFAFVPVLARCSDKKIIYKIEKFQDWLFVRFVFVWSSKATWSKTRTFKTHHHSEKCAKWLPHFFASLITTCSLDERLRKTMPTMTATQSECTSSDLNVARLNKDNDVAWMSETKMGMGCPRMNFYPSYNHMTQRWPVLHVKNHESEFKHFNINNLIPTTITIKIVHEMATCFLNRNTNALSMNNIWRRNKLQHIKLTVKIFKRPISQKSIRRKPTKPENKSLHQNRPWPLQIQLREPLSYCVILPEITPFCSRRP